MTVRNPQLFKSADVKDVHKFVNDPGWALEQKVDGMRCLTSITADSIEFFTRGGRPLKSAAAKLHFDHLRDSLSELQGRFVTPGTEVVFDAELITDTGELVLLDMPYAGASERRLATPDLALAERRAMLRDIYFSIVAPDIRLVAHASTVDTKLELVHDVRRHHLEGLIAKRLDSPYSEGERVDHSYKLKFTETADVVVLAKNDGESRHSKRGGDKINYVFGVYDSTTGAMVHMGNCSGIGKEDAAVGDVIEVEYLYVGAGGRLVQPRMLQRRPDKPAAACRTSQFSQYSKTVL